MNVHQGHHSAISTTTTSTNPSCLLVATESKIFQPQAEDILTDEDLLDLFRIVKQVLRKKPDSDKLAKLLFCVSYALGDHVKFFKPLHEDKIIFRDDTNAINNTTVNSVRLPNNSSCCINSQEEPNSSTTAAAFRTTTTKDEQIQKWQDITSSPTSSSSVISSQSPLTRLLGSNHLNNNNQQQSNNSNNSNLSNTIISSPTTSSAIHPTARISSPITNHHPHPTTTSLQHINPPLTSTTSEVSIHSEETTTDPYTVRPYTNFRPIYTSNSSPTIPTSFERTDHQSQNNNSSNNNNENNNNRYPQDTIASPNSNSSSNNHASPLNITDLYLPHTHNPPTSLPDHGLKPHSEIVMEPKQRGFYYQDGRITREPVLLQRYAEQGILTQASLMRKRKRQSTDTNMPFEGNQLPAPTKKPKIPHRHGEFEQRRDDIINRMRTITMQDLEQKAQRMPVDFALVIEETQLPENLPSNLTKEQAGEYLEPALHILTSHSNMKPHLDNGMNQNGIYYNSDYFRLYMAFEQFQKAFATLFPHEVVNIPEDDLDGSIITAAASLNNTNGGGSGVERDKDRERNANMKAYRSWIEPLLTDTNWAAFRRNIVVGERMMQLTKVVGQGVLLMTKELSGSKLHLTFTNNEWDEFITGLSSGRWDQTIKWDSPMTPSEQNAKKSRLVLELRQKFITAYWFNPEGTVVPPKDRKLLYRSISAATAAANTNPSSSSSSSNNSSTNSSLTTLSSPNHHHTLDHHHPHPHHHQQQHRHHQNNNDHNNNNIDKHENNSNMVLHNTNDTPFQNNEISILADIIQ